MALRVEWDGDKAQSNARKHGVSFEEAVSALMDPLGLTIPDDVHSEEEERHVATGQSSGGRLLVVIYADRGMSVRTISASLVTKHEERTYEETLDDTDDDDMKDDYDFSGGVRGRLVGRFQHGANIAVIAPDLMDVFPDSESVNAALRPLAELARAHAKAVTGKKSPRSGG